MIAIGGVLLLHLLFGVMLLRSQGRTFKPVAEPPRVVLRLLPGTTAAGPRDFASPSDPRSRPAAPRRLREAEPINPAPSAEMPGLAAGQAISTPGPELPDPHPPDSAASEPVRRLDLSLPRAFLRGAHPRNPALDDPRSNRATPSPDERMARTLGTDQTLVEEDMGHGVRRFRQGSNCVIARPGRAAQLDPFSGRPQPALLDSCD